jgi:hypothetical protein
MYDYTYASVAQWIELAWVNEDYGSYTIRAAFDGNPEGTLMNSSSPTGRIYFASN